MRLGDLAHDREPESRPGEAARRTRAIEAVEDVGKILVGDSRPVVSHNQPSVPDCDLDLAAGGAPLRRVVEQVPDRSLDGRRNALDHGRLQLDVVDDLGPVATSSLDHIRDQEVEPYVLRLRGHLLGPCELDELRDERRHLPELLDDVREQPGAILGRKHPVSCEDLDVRAHARERRSELVRCVGDELPLRPRRFLESPEHRVEAGCKTAELVVARDLDALREILRLTDAFDRLGELANRRQRRACDHEPEAGRNDDAAGGDQEQHEPDPTKRLVDLGHRTRYLDGGIRPVGEGEDTEVRAVDRDVRPVRGTLRSGHREYLVVDRNSNVLPGWSQNRSVGSNELDVPTRLAELRANREIALPARPSGKDAELLGGDLRRSDLERFVDRGEQLLARHEVEEDRSGDDGKSDRRRRRDGDTRPERHASRSA